MRRQEPGHQYIETMLISMGASAPRAGTNPAVWLREVLVALGAQNIRHRGPHRFCGRFSRVAAWPMTVPGRRASVGPIELACLGDQPVPEAGSFYKP